MILYSKIICGLKYNININIARENSIKTIEQRSARLIANTTFDLFPANPNSSDIHSHYKEYLQYGEDVASLGMAFQLLRTDLSHKRSMIMNLSQDLDHFISGDSNLLNNPDSFHERFTAFFSGLKSPSAYWSTSHGIFGEPLLTPCMASSSVMSFAAKSLGYQVQYRVGWLPLVRESIDSFESLERHIHLGLANDNNNFIALDAEEIIYRGDILDGPNLYNASNSYHYISQKETLLFSEILNSQYYINRQELTDEQVKEELLFGEKAVELDPENIGVGKRLADNYMFLAIRLKSGNNKLEALKYALKSQYIYQNLSLMFEKYLEEDAPSVARSISRDIEPKLNAINDFVDSLQAH